MATEAPKKRGPGRPRKHEPKLALYHIYQDEGTGQITWLGEENGRNATNSLQAFLTKNEKFAKGDKPYVVVPDRNISRISATIETVKKLTVEAS